MAEKIPQTFANHTRLDPLYHFVALPLVAFALIGGVIHFLWRPSWHSGSFFVLSVAAAIIVTKLRVYPLKVQDRVIRLEERLRLAALLPEPLRARINELSVDQLVGLRFASDGELPALVERTLRENLNRKQIKQAIVSWRADDWRV